MILIIGLSLSFIAIGVLYYLNNQLKKRLERNNKALLALQQEFTQYLPNEVSVEHDPIEIWDSVKNCISKIDDQFSINQLLELNQIWTYLANQSE